MYGRSALAALYAQRVVLRQLFHTYSDKWESCGRARGVLHHGAFLQVRVGALVYMLRQ